jgi:hypothetical protein
MFAAEDLKRVQARVPADMDYAPGVLGPSERARGEPGRKGKYTDEWGRVWHVGEDGVVGEVKEPPLADWSALGRFQPPWEMIRNADTDKVLYAVEKNLAGDNPKFMRAGSSIRPFERLQFLRGSENLYADLGYDSAELRTLRDMVHEFFLAELDLVCSTPVDGVSFMDDWGSQKTLLISPAMWREFFKPLYRDYCERIRRAGKKIFFHSDGNISSIYPDLIELGVDAVNSQLFAMDIEELGRLYRGHVTFWGEIDRQHVLPFGTVRDVRSAVGRVRRALGDTRGGTFAQCEWGCHVPPGNIEAVYEAWLAPIDELP